MLQRGAVARPAGLGPARDKPAASSVPVGPDPALAPFRYTGAHGFLPAYLPRVRTRFRRTIAHPGARIVPLGALAQERLLLRQPAKPLLACDGRLPGPPGTAERWRPHRRRDAHRDPRGIHRRETAPAAGRRHRAVGRHRVVRHQGLQRRQHQKRRARRYLARARDRAHRGRHLQRRNRGAAVQALLGMGSRACRARPTLHQPRERRLVARAAGATLERRADPAACRRRKWRPRRRATASARTGKRGRRESSQLEGLHALRTHRLRRDSRRHPARFKLGGPQKHAGQQVQEHQARAARAREAARGGPGRLPAAMEGAGASGHRLAGQARRHRGARMLLAPLPALQPQRSEKEHPVLGSEVRAQRAARRGKSRSPGSAGLARACRLGVRA